MKRITHSKKTLGAVLIGAAGLALGTVGFSAWVVGNGSANSESSLLGVNVADVTDNLVAFTAQPAWDTSNVCVAGSSANVSSKMLVDNATTPTTAYVVFGPESGDSTGPITASGNGVSDLEHLWVKFAFTVSWPSDQNIDLSVTFTGSTAIGKLTSAGSSSTNKAYIVNPDGVESGSKSLFSDWNGATAFTSATGWAVSLGSLSNANGRKAQTVTVTLSWAWGATFNNVNPGQATDSNVAATLNNLKNGSNGLYDLLNGAGNITMTVTAAVHS